MSERKNINETAKAKEKLKVQRRYKISDFKRYNEQFNGMEDKFQQWWLTKFKNKSSQYRSLNIKKFYENGRNCEKVRNH